MVSQIPSPLVLAHLVGILGVLGHYLQVLELQHYSAAFDGISMENQHLHSHNKCTIALCMLYLYTNVIISTGSIASTYVNVYTRNF